MKPEQFIREFGVDKAREAVEGAPEGTTHYDIPFEVYLRSTEFWNGNEWKEVDNLTIQDLELPPFVNLSDLKRLVESLDLVNCFDDLEQAKSWVSDMDEDFPYVFKGDTYDNRFYKHELVTAIADHESIYGGGDE